MKRPSGVVIAAVLAIATGILQLLASLYYFGVTAAIPSVTPDLSAFATSLVTSGGVLLAVLGVLAFVFAYGALGLRSWSWTMGVTLFVLDVIFAIGVAAMTTVTLGPVIGGLLSLAIIGYLYTHSVREALGHEHHVMRGHTPSPTA